MDAKLVHEALLKLSIQIEEVNTTVQEMKTAAEKRSETELLRRLEKIEESVRSQSLKIDTLSAIDITPTVVVPNPPAAVRIAGDIKEDPKAAAPDTKEDAKAVAGASKETPKYLGNITEFFKHLWSVDQKVLYSKGVITEEDMKKIQEENKSKLDKKKNELVKANSLAFTIWRSLPDAKKEIVYALKVQYAADYRKKASVDIGEEKEK